MLQRLKDKNITQNESKCKFNKSKLALFGLIFQKEGVSLDPRLVEDFNNLETPRSVGEVRSLLRVAQYSAKFIQDYSTITEPLRTLTHKNTNFKWDTPQQTAFDTLKKVLCTHPVMSYFDVKKHTEIVCDASPVGTSVILAQKSTKDSEHRNIVAYASRALTPVEQRYSQTEREALAIEWGVERIHLFLYGAPHFEIITDHKALETIYNHPSNKPPARIERWQLRLQNYNFTVKYGKGSGNPSDYLSRHPNQSITAKDLIAKDYVRFISSHAVTKAITIEEIEIATSKDPHCKKLSNCTKVTNGIQ